VPASVFLLGAPDSGVEALERSLTIIDTPGEPAVVTLGGEGGSRGSVGLLAEAMPEARFVFLATAETDHAPPELAALDANRWCRVERSRLLADPRSELRRVCEFAGIVYDQARLTPIEMARRAEMTSEAASPFGSASTDTFAQLVQDSGGSVLISTYQTHRLVAVRVRDGELNTHFRGFDKPMGIAVAPGRLALGTRTEVWDLRDMPEAAPRLEPAGTHDACYLPRKRHVTGDVAVHELGFVQGHLWIVATAFSCLATLDGQHSFVPRWTPQFITRLAPEDRCHLNGMARLEDGITHVTALGVSDAPSGWREGKAAGGVLIDVARSEIVLSGLSMPHSPRWHQGRLWLLESGRGTLCRADLQTGRVETVIELPGFTRGLAFIGDTALVGLSQIRESSTFGDLPLTRRLEERLAGVWMVDLRSGTVTGFLRFEDLVQEVFDVAVLPGARYPEIAAAESETTARSYALP
jgi:uncharacterized protein (TIGR03032 family)